jgi:hypothetical protein
MVQKKQIMIKIDVYIFLTPKIPLLNKNVIIYIKQIFSKIYIKFPSITIGSNKICPMKFNVLGSGYSVLME